MDVSMSSSVTIEPPPLLFGPRPPSPHPSHSNSSTQLPPLPSQAISRSSTRSAVEMDQSSFAPPAMQSPRPAETEDSEMEDSDDSTSAADGNDARPQDAMAHGVEVMDITPGLPLAQPSALPEQHLSSSQASPAPDNLRDVSVSAALSIPPSAESGSPVEQQPDNAGAEGAMEIAPVIVDQVTQSVPGDGTRASLSSSPLAAVTGVGDPPLVPPPNISSQPRSSTPSTTAEPEDSTHLGRADDYSDTSSESSEEPSDREDYVEDTSTPDEEEIKEIEASAEVDATDHQHYENTFFQPLDDPEYIPGEQGRIQWTITGVRGTYEKPNRVTVMKSPPVRIGGLDWNLKFFPRGNDTDNFSVYLACSKPPSPAFADLQVQESHAENVAKRPTEPSAQNVNGGIAVSSVEATLPNPRSPNSPENLLLGSTLETDRTDDRKIAPTDSEDEDTEETWSTAAEFGVVMYNPNEPRVNVSLGNQHRFCKGSPDWGWTRFHGPHNKAHLRFRGQRQPLLRNDTLSFTAFVRTVKDETGALWDHPTKDSEWDSFAKTGIRALKSEDVTTSFVTAAISSWLLLAPFRRVISSATTHVMGTYGDENEKISYWTNQKRLLVAFQQILRDFYTQKPTSAPVSLERLVDAHPGGGIALAATDVVKYWQTLRMVLDQELRGTEMEGELSRLFDGTMEQTVTDGKAELHTKTTSVSAGLMPSFRVPVKGVKNIQDALAKKLNGDEISSQARFGTLPKVLHIELKREEFDTDVKKWKKLVNRVDLDENVDLKPWVSDPSVETAYTLYGFVVHKGDLQSGLYHSVLRPAGPGTKWFAIYDGHEASEVRCLTRKQAVEENQGSLPGEKHRGTEAVAYVVMYVRNDVRDEVLRPVSEQYELPEWAKAEPKFVKPEWLKPAKITTSTAHTDNGVTVDLDILNLQEFKGYHGQGALDFSTDSDSLRPDLNLIRLKVPVTSTIANIQEKIVDVFDGVQDPRQCLLWARDNEYHYSEWPGFWSGCPAHLMNESWSLDLLQLREPKLRLFVRKISPQLLEGLSGAEKAKTGGEETQSGDNMDVETTTATVTTASLPLEGSAPTALAGVIHRSQPGSPRLPAEDAPMEENSSQDSEDSQMTDGPAENAEDGTPQVFVVNLEAHDQEMSDAVEPDEQAATGDQADQASSVAVSVNEHDERTNRVKLLLIKRYDPEEQSLKGVGAFVGKMNEKLGDFVRRVLDLPPEKSFLLWHEVDTTDIMDLKLDSTLSEPESKTQPVILPNASIIVVQDKCNPQQEKEVRRAGGFAILPKYIDFLNRARDLPYPDTGAQTLDYFSSIFYSGDLKNNSFHGKGKLIALNGDTYEGDFVSNMREGTGKMTFQNGDVYEGSWRADLMEGMGKFNFAKTGNRYIGNYRAGRRHGKGVMNYLVADEEQQLCQICYEGEMDSLFYDCGHVCACLECAKQLSSCPVCRKELKGVVKIYKAC